MSDESAVAVEEHLIELEHVPGPSNMIEALAQFHRQEENDMSQWSGITGSSEGPYHSLELVSFSRSGRRNT